MVVKKLVSIIALTVYALSFEARVRAEDSPLVEMESDTASRYGGRLAENFTKSVPDVQVKIDADAEKAVGLYNPSTNLGIIAVPVKGWKEDPQNKDVDKENGAGMCYVFMSQPYNPLIDGKPIDAKKLRKLKFKDGNGNEREATCLVCSVKRDGDDWKLYVYGADKQPLIKSSFDDDAQAPKQNLALTIKDVKDGKASLVISLFGKYSASIAIGHKND